MDLQYVSKARVLHLASVKLEVLDSAARACESVGVSLSLDLSGEIASLGFNELYERLRKCRFLFLNSREFKALTGLNPSLDLVERFARKTESLTSVKLGEKGVIVSDGRETFRVPAFKVEVVDTTGAGDAYAAGFTYAFLSGFSLEECGRIGNAVAALKIRREGAREGLPTLGELEEFL